jgi:hypothetical protein
MAKLRPFGSSTKLRPFGSKTINRGPTELERAIQAHDAAIAEELKLFAVVDKYDLAGKGDTPQGEQARKEWEQAWRKRDRAYVALARTIARDRSH